MDRREALRITRREALKLGFLSGGAVLIGSSALHPNPAFGLFQCPASTGPNPCGGAIEVFPTSPLILNPFVDALPIPPPLKPVPQSEYSKWSSPPNPVTGGQQDSIGGVHQLGPEKITYNGAPLPAPIVYKIDLGIGPASITSSQVQAQVNAVDAGGNIIVPAGAIQSLPPSAVFGFNSQPWGGVRINAEYGKPALVRFENHLDENPYNLDTLDFGSPDRSFLTHLHNGHTAPESDGNPNYHACGYAPGQWVDNLYLNWPAGDTLSTGDDKEKQSFFWFHDHRMDHTGADVYKGMVGLYPIYDPDNLHDDGIESKGYRLPGVKTVNTFPDGTSNFGVDYDIPLALYDCRLDDGATQHQDFHNGCGETHPEWWGQLFFRHFPNHGFVGDIFTVNGKAFPVLTVKRRRYRLRFLDASISRIYQLQFQRKPAGGSVKAFPGHLGQYNFADSAGNKTQGQECMKVVQIGAEGGLLPYPILRDSFEIWPAKRREVIVDFGKYLDGSPTSAGDEIYIVNILQMSTGRKPDDGTTTTEPDGTTFTAPPPDPNYAVPILKIIIDGDAVDNSFDPLVYANGTCSLKLNPTTLLPLLKMRATPNLPRSFSGVTQRIFKFERSGTAGGEIQWLIRNCDPFTGSCGPQLPFDPTSQMAFPVQGSPELWTFQNGGGGWVHPVHIHMEEHHVISRDGVLSPQISSASGSGTKIDYSLTYGSVSNPDPGDNSKEDVVGLKPGESVTFYRNFRTFKGPYVCHCHNLAHEDHAMMFGWTIV